MATHHHKAPPPLPPRRDGAPDVKNVGVQRYLTSPFLKLSKTSLMRRRLVADLHGYRPLTGFVFVLVLAFGLLTVTEFFRIFQAARALGLLETAAPTGPVAGFLEGTGRWQARLCTFIATMVLLTHFVARANQNGRALGGNIQHDDSARVVGILAAPIANVLVQAYGPVTLLHLHLLTLGPPPPSFPDGASATLAITGVMIYMLGIWQVDALARLQDDRYRALARDTRWATRAI